MKIIIRQVYLVTLILLFFTVSGAAGKEDYPSQFSKARGNDGWLQATYDSLQALTAECNHGIVFYRRGFSKALAVNYADEPSSPPKSVSEGDFVIKGMPYIQIGSQITPDQADSYFGKPDGFSETRGGEGFTWRAYYRSVFLWVTGIDGQVGSVERALIRNIDYSTNRGVKNGDPEARIFAAYGQPNRSTAQNNVKYHIYYVNNDPLKRLIFGIDNFGRVAEIGYAHSAGGL